MPRRNPSPGETALYSWQSLPVATAVVALASTELAFFVVKAIELRATLLADVFVCALWPSPVTVLVPPCITAGICTEAFGVASSEAKGFTTLLTAPGVIVVMGVRTVNVYLLAVTEGFDAVDRKCHALRYN